MQALQLANPDYSRYNFCCADTETNGLDPNSDEILEVAVREFNMSGELGSAYTHLCRPLSGVISEKITTINGITMEMVKDMPSYLKHGVHQEVAKFIGQRTLIGHNIIAFDLGFLKVKPLDVCDTLKMSRERFPRGKNNLKSACLRMDIEWNDNEAHRALYDVDKTIELFWKYSGVEAAKKIEAQQTQMFASAEIPAAQPDIDKALGAQPAPNNFSAYLNIGVQPTDEHKLMMATQAYSYSRISLFDSCPYKWFFSYILKIKEPDHDHFKFGNAAHEVAENSGAWCQRELFIRKFVAWQTKTGVVIPAEITALINSENLRDVAELLYSDRSLIGRHYCKNSLAGMHHEMDAVLCSDDYEKPAMPDENTYARYIRIAAVNEKMNDSALVKDFEKTMWRYYRYKDFSKSMSKICITEKKLAFDKNWNTLSDFFDKQTFFRGVIDLIEFVDREIIVTDYKSSRTMKSQSEIAFDMQLKIYVFLLCKLLPKGSFDKVTVRIEYIRFCCVIEHTFEDIDRLVNEVELWIAKSVDKIEREILKTGGDAFLPTRNENCGTCHIGIDGKCPLFNKKFLQNIDDENFVVSNDDECRAAWKRIEANKMESARLLSQCKNYIKSAEKTVVIDRDAVLDFWVTESREYYAFDAAVLLLKHGYKIEDFISFMSFPESDFKNFTKKVKLVLSDEELAQISRVKMKHTCDAYTPEHALKKKCINIDTTEEK